MISLIIAFLGLLSGTVAITTPAAASPVCNHDNLYRALVDPRYSSSARAFCSTYISLIPISTSTMTAATVTVSSGTSTGSTTTSPNPVIIISTPTITVEATATVNSTVYTAYTAPSAVSVSVEKRDVALPPFVSGYPASRISSGCSCLTISTSTSTSTSTTTPATTVPATTVINTVTAPQETSTVIASPTTVTTTTTTTSYYVLPTLCDPVNFRDYRNFVESRPYLYRSIVGSTKQDCCLTCYNAKNCLSFIFDATRLQCNYYLVTSQASLSTRTDVCPLGVTVNSRQETPGWAYLPQNYGPCLASAPL